MSDWFYCLEHGSVEEGLGCRAAVRLGPYATSTKAAAALEMVEDRNDRWESDPRWNEDDER